MFLENRTILFYIIRGQRWLLKIIVIFNADCSDLNKETMYVCIFLYRLERNLRNNYNQCDFAYRWQEKITLCFETRWILWIIFVFQPYHSILNWVMVLKIFRNIFDSIISSVCLSNYYIAVITSLCLVPYL